VDLLPDISQPTINVRVNYTGVGPLEMEELVTRPLEQQLSAVSGVRQMNSTSSEGNSQIQMNFEWGHDLNEAMDDIRTRLDRVYGVAAVTVDGGLRRQIHVELSREKTTALDLSVDRVVNVLRQENQN